MIEAQKIIPVTLGELGEKVREYREKGYRLVQICSAQIGGTLELSYSFDKDYAFESLRLILKSRDEAVPSVSGIYSPAFLYENEMHDLYGITFKDLLLDYKGNFYRLSSKHPFFNAPPPPPTAAEGGAR